MSESSKGLTPPPTGVTVGENVEREDRFEREFPKLVDGQEGELKALASDNPDKYGYLLEISEKERREKAREIVRVQMGDSDTSLVEIVPPKEDS